MINFYWYCCILKEYIFWCSIFYSKLIFEQHVIIVHIKMCSASNMLQKSCSLLLVSHHHLCLAPSAFSLLDPPNRCNGLLSIPVIPLQGGAPDLAWPSSPGYSEHPPGGISTPFLLSQPPWTPISYLEQCPSASTCEAACVFFVFL